MQTQRHYATAIPEYERKGPEPVDRLGPLYGAERATWSSKQFHGRVFSGTFLLIAALAKTNLSLGLEYFCWAARGDHDP